MKTLQEAKYYQERVNTNVEGGERRLYEAEKDIEGDSSPSVNLFAR